MELIVVGTLIGILVLMLIKVLFGVKPSNDRPTGAAKMKEMPPKAILHSRSPGEGEYYDQDFIPSIARFLKQQNKPDTWGKIIVTEGKLMYRILEPQVLEFTLTPDLPGIVELQAPHEILMLGDAKFFVELYVVEPEDIVKQAHSTKQD